MKFSCQAGTLKKAFLKTDRLSSKNSTLPILQNILMVLDGDILTLRATNLHLGIEMRIRTEASEGGICLVKSALIKNIIQLVPDQEKISFELEENILSIKTPKSKMKLKTEQADDFPTLPEVLEGESTQISSNDLAMGMRSVFYSASTSDIKPEIASIFIYTDDKNLVFVATDTFRLAEKKVFLKKEISVPGILVPLKNTTELLKIFSEIDEVLDVHIGKNQISFSSADMYLTSRVIDGVFPDYRQILPKEYVTEAKILKDDLVQSLRMIEVFSDTFHQLKINVNPEMKECSFFSKNDHVGENTVRISSTIQGEDIEVSLNYKYLIDGLQSLSDESIVLSLNPGKPLVLHGSTDKTFTYLIMPIRH